MELLTNIFTAFGLSASAGLNAYIPLLLVGLLARYTNLIHLNKPWDTLSNPWIILLLCVLVIIEMLADKIPAVNHINDAIQTLIRPTAGAIAFASSANVITDVHPVLALALGLLIAGTVHKHQALLDPPPRLRRGIVVDRGAAGFGLGVADEVDAVGHGADRLLTPRPAAPRGNRRRGQGGAPARLPARGPPRVHRQRAQPVTGVPVRRQGHHGHRTGLEQQAAGAQRARHAGADGADP